MTATIPAAFGYVKVTVDEATAQRIEKDRTEYELKCETAQKKYPKMKLAKK